MTRALVIGETERAAIKAAIQRASANPILLADVKKHAIAESAAHLTLQQVEESMRGWRRTPAQQVLLPFGYRAAISIEQQPIGLCKHLSISVDGPGNLPNPAAVKMIAQEFGVSFPAPSMWLEEFDPGHEAINLVEPIMPAAGNA